MIRIIVFAVVVILALVGIFLCLDAFLPKEKPTSLATPIVEFLVGFWLVGLAAVIHSKFGFKKARGGPPNR